MEGEVAFPEDRLKKAATSHRTPNKKAATSHRTSNKKAVISYRTPKITLRMTLWSRFDILLEINSPGTHLYTES